MSRGRAAVEAILLGYGMGSEAIEAADRIMKKFDSIEDAAEGIAAGRISFSTDPLTGERVTIVVPRKTWSALIYVLQPAHRVAGQEGG